MMLENKFGENYKLPAQVFVGALHFCDGYAILSVTKVEPNLIHFLLFVRDPCLGCLVQCKMRTISILRFRSLPVVN